MNFKKPKMTTKNCPCCLMQSFEEMINCVMCGSNVCWEPCSETCSWCQERVCKKDIWECDYCDACACAGCVAVENKGWSHPECCWHITLCPSCATKHLSTYCAFCGGAVCASEIVECKCNQPFCSSCAEMYCVCDRDEIK